jgi:sugar lactone lactonase YvrE
MALCTLCATSSRAQAQTSAPRYEVDAAWPKALPNRWVLGGLGGVCVDNNDHVLILHRQDVLEADLNGGVVAPPIIEIDPGGKVVNSWGDAKLLDPRLHSCFFDKNNNAWIASAPSGMVQQYTHDGRKLLFQIGKKDVFDSSDGTVKGKMLNSNAAQFFGPASIFVDPANGDVYVADGENSNWNRRVAVIDRQGKFLRQWQPEGKASVHCLAGASDGTIYVCNRQTGLVQVYDKQGHLLKNIEVPRTSAGTDATAIAFSPDPDQKLIYVLNQATSQVEIIDRHGGNVLSSFGGVGQGPGQFEQPHGIAVDSKGNVYIAENRGKRVQKFRIVGQ